MTRCISAIDDFLPIVWSGWYSMYLVQRLLVKNFYLILFVIMAPNTGIRVKDMLIKTNEIVEMSGSRGQDLGQAHPCIIMRIGDSEDKSKISLDLICMRSFGRLHTCKSRSIPIPPSLAFCLRTNTTSHPGRIQRALGVPKIPSQDRDMGRCQGLEHKCLRYRQGTSYISWVDQTFC